MHPTLSPRAMNALRKALLLVITCSIFSCQEAGKSEETGATPPSEAATLSVADTTEARPAPTFFVIPPELAEQRVWICENASADIFHVQHDCPLLVQCKGKGSFRNLTLVRAIEDYDRYNCQVCSEELDHIFDEDLVR